MEEVGGGWISDIPAPVLFATQPHSLQQIKYLKCLGKLNDIVLTLTTTWQIKGIDQGDYSCLHLYNLQPSSPIQHIGAKKTTTKAIFTM